MSLLKLRSPAQIKLPSPLEGRGWGEGAWKRRRQLPLCGQPSMPRPCGNTLTVDPAMPLTGVRVLDLTRLLPGAFCTMLLADMGADVVRVEEPAGGDFMRWTPPLVEGQSALFNALNRNKRSLTLNLKSEAGRDLLLRLVDHAAVLVEGNRPGVMQRLGIGWDVLHTRN